MTLSVPEEVCLGAYLDKARHEFYLAVAHTRGDKAQIEQRGKALDEAVDRLGRVCDAVTEENKLLLTLQKGKT